MENQDKNTYNTDPEANDPSTGNGVLVGEKTEGVTVDEGQMDRQDKGLGEENYGDDFLGKANKEKE